MKLNPPFESRRVRTQPRSKTFLPMASGFRASATVIVSMRFPLLLSYPPPQLQKDSDACEQKRDSHTDNSGDQHVTAARLGEVGQRHADQDGHYGPNDHQIDHLCFCHHLRVLFLLLLDLGPSVAQSYGAVEHGSGRCRVLIHAEVTQALELELLAGP